MTPPAVKICGIGLAETAGIAFEAGADYLGLVFAPSPRQVNPEQAKEIVRAVPGRYIGVFRNMTDLDYAAQVAETVGIFGIQCHGCSPAGWVAWAKTRGLMAVATDLRVADADVWLLDGPRSGSGISWEWELPNDHRPYWIAGGLRPDNVRQVVERLSPAGVDVSSGVETDGQKDPIRIVRFIKEAKAWPR